MLPPEPPMTRRPSLSRMSRSSVPLSQPHAPCEQEAPVRADVASRRDIDELLTAFYSDALVDPLLGPVFATAGLDLATHLPRIGDFWQRSLLGSGSYEGQPMAVHRHLHQRLPLTAPLFERWLALWSAAVDAGFSGPVAARAKDQARRVAEAMQVQLNRRTEVHEVALVRPTALHDPMEELHE
jgi:hemoglobin